MKAEIRERIEQQIAKRVKLLEKGRCTAKEFNSYINGMLMGLVMAGAINENEGAKIFLENER